MPLKWYFGEKWKLMQKTRSIFLPMRTYSDDVCPITCWAFLCHPSDISLILAVPWTTKWYRFHSFITWRCRSNTNCISFSKPFSLDTCVHLLKIVCCKKRDSGNTILYWPKHCGTSSQWQCIWIFFREVLSSSFPYAHYNPSVTVIPYTFWYRWKKTFLTVSAPTTPPTTLIIVYSKNVITVSGKAKSMSKVSIDTNFNTFCNIAYYNYKRFKFIISILFSSVLPKLYQWWPRRTWHNPILKSFKDFSETHIGSKNSEKIHGN